MTIVREADWGGSYAAPLHLKVKLVFTPENGGEPVTARREIKLNAAPGSFWATVDQVGVTGEGLPVKVDTNGDQIADAVMPGPSNFAPGGIMQTQVLHDIAFRPACPSGSSATAPSAFSSSSLTSAGHLRQRIM